MQKNRLYVNTDNVSVKRLTKNNKMLYNGIIVTGAALHRQILHLICIWLKYFSNMLAWRDNIQKGDLR